MNIHTIMKSFFNRTSLPESKTVETKDYMVPRDESEEGLSLNWLLVKKYFDSRDRVERERITEPQPIFPCYEEELARSEQEARIMVAVRRARQKNRKMRKRG